MAVRTASAAPAAAASTSSADPVPDELTGNLCWLLGRVSHHLTLELSAALEEIGFPPRGHQVLAAAHTGSYTQIELARMVGLDKTTMVTTIDELEALGFATREPSPTDRRARIIAVTALGARKLREADVILAAIRDDVLDALPARERKAFMDALVTLATGRLAEPGPARRAIRRARASSRTR